METKLLKADIEGLTLGAELIKNGETVVFPTETVYGLGADATNEESIKKIFEAKGRPSDNPLIVHIADKNLVYKIAREVPEKAEILMDKFWPGPLTIILKKSDLISPYATAGLDTVGIRMPETPSAREFLHLAGVPVAAPSANISGKPSPTNFEDVKRDMTGRAGGIIEGEPSRVGIESTVIDMTGETPAILRPGGITQEEIEAEIGTVIGKKTLRDGEAPKAPGMKYRHYAPSGRVYIIKGSIEKTVSFLERIANQKKKVAVLFFDEFKYLFPENVKFISLGRKNSPQDAANRLFSALRETEKWGADLVFAPEIPENGLWYAVRNRLYKAAADNILDLDNLKSVLFVCTGNTCRSPMAEGVFAATCKGVFVSSAGLMTEDGMRATDNAIYAAAKMKIDISSHKSRQITIDMVKDADLVLTMTQAHKKMLSGFPNVYTLSEFAGEKGDITDPFGMGEEEYLLCLEEIKNYIEKIKI